ncbi:MAG TPA: alpha/beta fold hydrolase [Candidatus Eisenbacteria bacterium]|nr:alpha/beta fold hydrolase [Candidatus Eisenbacteria bacterium]
MRPVDRVVIIHGYGVTPEKMWFPWLHAELEKTGIAVTIPALPDPFRPNYKKWMDAVAPLAKTWTPDTLLVAHSLGTAFSIRLLETKVAVRLRAVVLVSPLFASTINVKPLVKFFARPIDWMAVRDHAREFTVIHAQDDPLVPFDHSLRYAEALGAKAVVRQTGGHFTQKKFPLLMRTIKPYLE